MAEIGNTTEIFRQNLVDAGCDEATIDSCLRCAEQGNWVQCLRELMEHRKNLLEALHSQQQRIDCLDFLTHKINKKQH